MKFSIARQKVFALMILALIEYYSSVFDSFGHQYGGRISTLKCGSDELLFVYDENGDITGFYRNGEPYVYAKNLQGDVTGIVNKSGAWVVSYEYDAWGKLLTVTGSEAATIGVLNPFRYRSYNYDEETGLYYLNSRYYDPEVGRFLNADSVLNQGSVIGMNLYSYCLDNPVNMSDATGNLPFFVVTAAIGAVVGAVIGGVVAAKNGGNVWAGIGIGAAAGALIGTGVGAAAGAALAGSITATTGAVMAGGSALITTISTGGLGAGAAYIANNCSQAANNIATASAGDPVKNALKKLDASGLRPGQTEIKRKNVMELVNNFDTLKATSSVYSSNGTRYLVEGHHTTVASTILNKGNCVNMGMMSAQEPLVYDVYWTKKWYEFGKTAIKIVED